MLKAVIQLRRDRFEAGEWTRELAALPAGAVVDIPFTIPLQVHGNYEVVGGAIWEGDAVGWDFAKATKLAEFAPAGSFFLAIL